MVVEEFVYLGSLIHSSTGSTCDISRRSAITRAAIESLENQIWRLRFTISTKLKLYNTCILPIFLYGSYCWATSKTDTHKIDALDQLTLIGHIMHMDDNTDAKRIMLASPPADWRRQPGRPRITWLSTVQQDLKQHHLTLPEAADLAQNRPLWRMMVTCAATQF